MIADIDVGVDLDHPDLANRWFANQGEAGADSRGRSRRSNRVDDDRNGYVDDWRGYDFFGRDPDVRSETRNSHGTQVAGVLGAGADNGRGIAGVAPGAAILPVRSADNILHQSGRLAEAITYAADRGAAVMSMSLGTDSNSAALYRAARYATSRGAVLVAASGNEFSFHHNLPGALDQTITVGGLNPDTANTTALNGSLALVGHGLQGARRLLGLRPPPRRGGANPGSHHRVRRRLHPELERHLGRHPARGRRGGARARPRQGARPAAAAARGAPDRERQRAGPGRCPRRARDRAGTASRATGASTRSRRCRACGRGRCPPRWTSPSPTPFQPANRDRFAVRGLVHGRSPARWALELGEGEEPGSWRTLATGGATRRRSKRLATVDPRRLGAGGYTLRLRATDSNGNRGEDRAFFSSMRDSLLKRGYPKQLGSSGESSPQLADLNGDGRQEIVLATSDGRVTVLSGRTGRRLRGWPRAMRSYGARVARRRLGKLRQGSLATPAVGNIAGGRGMEIVAAGLDGRVYAWTPAAAGSAGSRCGSTCIAQGATAAATRRSTPARPSPTWTGTASSTSSSARPTRRSTPGTAAAGGCPAGPCSPATPPAATWRRSSPPPPWAT